VRRTPPVRKSIFDPVHGVVELDEVALALIGHPSFQRLWGIRQTGFAHLVFPGANHTRLEHSLGVSFVAGTMADRLHLDGADRATVVAGALLHDLGHTPFSHTLEPSMVEATGRTHESVSRELIVDPTPAEPGGDSIAGLLDARGIRPNAVADLIDPPRRLPGLLAEILHGPIDADRIDYLQRDAHYTGVAHGAVDSARLLAIVRAHRGHLAFAEKGRSAVEGFLVGRALMYASVYYHKTVRAAEVMAQAAVERAPGFPATVGPWFRCTDGELLVRLEEMGGYPAQAARNLSARRLVKRAHSWTVVDAADRRRFGRLRRDPPERRAWEDRVAARLGAPPGAVLLDLAGLESRDGDPAGWGAVGILDGARITHPFARDPVWESFTRRPPSLRAVSVYVDPRFRSEAERRLRRRGADAD